MKIFKLSLVLFISALFFTACNQSQLEQAYNDRYESGAGAAGFGYDNDARWARENLDLQAVGELLQRADDAAELEYLLNNEDGVNNLDLNGDGYVDYVSVREFDDRYDDERGFSLYSMFGPDEIQEICSIIFDRNGYNNGYDYPGARVLLNGNEQIYGDNYYYETNWLDRDVPLVDWAFNDRNDYYRSPYYYNNYPDYYEPYPVVETVVYETRIREYYPQPIFIQTTQPTLVEEVKIVSPYREKTMTRVYEKLAKPTREQVEFKQKNPNLTEAVRVNREQVKNLPAKNENPFRESRNRFEKRENVKADKPNKFEKPDKQERVNFERQNQPKVERQNQQRVEKEQQRVEKEQRRAEQQQQRQSMRVERQQQRVERPQQQQQQRVERPQQMKQQPNNGGGNPNKGGGGGNPNKGGGNGNGGGGGGGKKGKG